MYDTNVAEGNLDARPCTTSVCLNDGLEPNYKSIALTVSKTFSGTW